MEEERAWARVNEDNRRAGFVKDSPLDQAVSAVVSATGEEGRLLWWHLGHLIASPDALDRVKARAGLPPGLGNSALAYIDRRGAVHLPFREALDLALRFARAEPEAALSEVENWEQRLSTEARVPGKDYLTRYVNERRAAWALVRQWAGHDAAVATREARIRKMERLVSDENYALEKAGANREAERFRRALGRA